jgi:hypothetical protein
MFSRTKFLPLLAVAVAGLGATALAVPASAATSPHTSARPATTVCYNKHDLDFYGTHISIRPDPDTTRAANGFGNHGDCWFQLYQTTGQSVYCPLTGSYSNQWSSGSDVRTGVGGYVNWCYLEID